MSSLFGESGGAKRARRQQMALQAKQERKLNEQERTEARAEGARKRAMRGRTARSAGSNDTLFGGYLGVPSKEA